MSGFVHEFMKLAAIWVLCQSLVCVAASRLQLNADNHHPALRFDFYKESCPQLDQIVNETVAYYNSQDPTTPAPLLRLLFHDCFVQGCDASVLINTSKKIVAEKDADINFSLGNFFIIDEIKHKLEQVCPDTVSCADVLAVTAVYSIKLAGGPLYPIELGRRDALTSYAPSSQVGMPAFHLNVSGLLENFKSAGLDIVDLVALSGGHTIGQGHCKSIADRLYPKLDPQYKMGLGKELLRQCTDNGTLHAPHFDPDYQYFIDPVTPLVFDNQYFKNLGSKLGLFTSDKDLFHDPRTIQLVEHYATNQTAFFEQFGISLRKMGRINVLTGTQGQIRKQCWVRNSHNADPTFDPDK
ncbi:hypothetical protein O6H91_06G135500 [Diphasiastrum complanatum]|uniref:Uncharacterized protein n=1 Tax=Diphasiastrum complanatum TaxID=34168 RepID=A0ACC2DJH8_DIPCM|nr:hypothetical protein O6H91_06G135500 [Diphasiastrum complanatum]